MSDAEPAPPGPTRVRFASLRHLAIVGALTAASLSSALVLTGLLAGLVVLALGAPLDTSLPSAVNELFRSDSPLVMAVAIVSTAIPLALAGVAMGTTLGPLGKVMRVRRVRVIDVVLAVIGMVAVSTAAGALVSLLGLVDEGALAELNAKFLSMPMSTRLMMVPATALAPGIAEELFFRGWVLSRGERHVSRALAVWVSAIAFGLVHFDPGHAIAATIMGLYLAFVVLRTGSIFAVVIAHVCNNVIATLAPELNGSGAEEWWVIAIGMAGGIVVGALMMWRLARRNPVVHWAEVVRPVEEPVPVVAVPEDVRVTASTQDPWR